MARTRFGETYPKGGDLLGERRKRRLDPATLLGLAAAFGLVALAMAINGSPKSFFDAPALLIVLGGTLGVTTIAFSLEDVVRTQQVIARTIFHATPDAKGVARKMMELATIAHRRGELAIENAVNGDVGSPFGRRALQMVVDGETPEVIENVLKREIEETTQRHFNSASVLRKAADTAPAMGLIGTLIGLVQMLGNLEDPATIGPNMAIALLTTFYGAVLSSMFFTPLAAKLERNSDREAVTANLYMYAALSISRNESPRRLEAMLNALLPPTQRFTNFA